ncbi:MAG: metallophosphoesterase family protein [Anaerotruncus sp.]|nr:MAG: metallophosphoesterase family protein [Anaerotruncus sp.]
MFFYVPRAHLQSKKTGLRDYLAAATACKADIALFGHTHCPVCKEMNGIYFFNPGALADGSYGIIDIEKQHRELQARKSRITEAIKKQRPCKKTHRRLFMKF